MILRIVTTKTKDTYATDLIPRAANDALVARTHSDRAGLWLRFIFTRGRAVLATLVN